MSLAQDEIAEVRGGLMTGMTGYAQPLRAIGQALETLNLKKFELRPVGEDFLVQGTLARANPESSDDPLTIEKLSAIWGRLPALDREGRDRQRETNGAFLTPIELQYTLKDVERLEQEGQAKRVDPHRMPDTSSLSQVLRCVGAYLNQKRARLLRLAREAESIYVEYETTLGSNITETLAVGELYDLWVRMYLQRAERVSQ